MTPITPRLVVADARAAQQFYQRAFGAQIGMCLTASDDSVVHAEVTLAGADFSLTEPGTNRDPRSLGDTPVILVLVVDDPDAVQQAVVDAGGEVVFPVADQFYGKREGRVRDPFGHEWMLSALSEDLDEAELQKLVSEWTP